MKIRKNEKWEEIEDINGNEREMEHEKKNKI